MTSRERIIQAAVVTFAGKGRHGAHMEDIAAAAGINKAMIYYIFHGKNELYQEVLKKVLCDIFAEILSESELQEKDASSADILARQINGVIAVFSRHPDFSKIIAHAVCNGEAEVVSAVSYCKKMYGSDYSEGMSCSVRNGAASGQFRDVDPGQLRLSICGMALIFYFSRSLCDILDIEVGDEKEFLDKRKQSIIDLLLYGVVKR